MFPGSPSQAQIIGNSRTTTGLLATVPAGMTLTANIGMTAAVAVLGTATPTVTVNGTNAAPAAGTVLARLTVSGLLAAAAAAAEDFEVIVKAPPENSVTLDFTAGGVGASSATINGWYFS
jgi:hypothetical protein